MIQVIGNRVTTLRQARGLSRGRLAFLSGLTRSGISQIEQDLRPGAQAVAVGRLAAALQTTTDYLLDLTDDPTPPPPIDWGVDPAHLAPLQPLIERLLRLAPDHRQPVIDAILTFLEPPSAENPPP